jgi:hypothetical protein
VFALAKLERHFAGAPASGRMRFLLAYANGDRGEAHRWWREIAAIAPRLMRRDVAHWQRTATRSGRRFEEIEFESAGVVWRGFSRRGAPIDEFRARLAVGHSGRPARVGATAVLCPIDASTDRDAARAWGLAQSFYQRRLMTEPLALLRSPGATVLALADPDDLVMLSAVSAGEVFAALVVAIDRLLGVGMDVGRLRRDALAFSRRHRRVLLLDPTLCAPERRTAESGRSAARAWAARLLA